ncbi:Small-conductance mechanosensitive channel [Enhydrobacter aerosaccus]|uniref:Small-conductance mechanosensitive channel n=2 Tax=Enhydrobacter aerosaccus TaxID=225324 RepID=A0A1T4SPU0_9HYPH|nr:Small-conductance mechanosensitive channel [Enhydrobacter aerosaccus]
MHDPLASLGLLALAVFATIIAHGRGLLVRMGIEAVLLLAIGTYLLWRGSSPLPHLGSGSSGLADAWLRALVVVWWLVGARLVVNVIVFVRGRDQKSREARLFSDLASAIIYITAIWIILNSVLDLNVQGLLVTSGVIAIVLGLALQNTLADVFCGLAIGLEQPFHVGDRISIGDSVEGVIVQMNWRSLRIHTDDDDIATVPNSLVAKGLIVNRSVPTRHRVATVETVAPAEVAPETILDLIWQATLLCPSILSVPAPSITLCRTDLVSNTYAARFSVSDSSIVAAAKSSLLRQVRRLFRYGGIGRPHPMSVGELLRSLTLFEALSQEEVDRLARDLIVQSVSPGDTIFEQEAISSSIYVIEAGVLELSRESGQSGSRVLGRIGAGEYIGELGLITGSPRSFTLKALTHGKALELPGAALAKLLHSNAALNAEMERSVRKGLAQIHRDDAARDVAPTDQPADLFAQIRMFFRV